MSERFWLTMAWMFCVAMGALARIVISWAMGMWSLEGTLDVDPWLLAFVDGVPTFVAGALFVYIFCCPDEIVIRLNSKDSDKWASTSDTPSASS